MGHESGGWTNEDQKASQEPKKCGFEISWVGKCKEAVQPGGSRCEKHYSMKCASCGAPATHDCPETGQFVCGAPLCDDCEHTTAKNGTNGGIGFYRASPLPPGFKDHCKKSEQVYEPWYARKENLP